ncbi:flagellar biosynthetic protein FliR [Paenibacillus sp. VTT E-133280]|jgi:flagellar biosynthetic protein FliR|uniref:Flagellar biosynthetic protein FliR n=1 Tax=Paenibacillus odorifer TaxID=189426 RepID=A0A1R0XZI7_9BACL|nr:MULTISPECIES: flagellar biosynthetic protein FliR [Paenibacillus]MBY3618662.1 flagellar type III secretion system protein FliR [Acinetobacter sp. CUI P1]AIQ24708.1 flagellar biosynthesis protein FliR [Paenibacillus sp. FSL H7-0737]KAA1185149.1 flagellar type III secretion system protein FliR [Paenibacillus sp. B2(2019)]MDH6369159.1 flagellar biosynthetic protein FliR [Paenibacillus sp. PastF-3]OMD40503.1 flagellar biosynthetic protein FliR [Paenibacillus odorifer]
MDTLLQSLPVFLLIFCRITAFFVVVPVFSSQGVPTTFKIGISFFVALVVFSANGTGITIPQDFSYILLIMREVLIGLLLGFIGYLMFMAIQTAGSFIDIQIGFGIANVIDPMTGTSAPILGNFKYMIALLMFLSMNGHHHLLDAIVYSYKWIPMNNDLFLRMVDGSLSEFLVRTFAQSFVLAFQMSAPLVTALFLTDVGLAFLARTAPQYNVFVIGVPLKIIIGIALLLVLMPGLAVLFQNLFEIMFESMENLLGLMGKKP